MENGGSLQKSTLSGMIWKFAERIGAQLVSTIVAIVLARLLSPDDYSVISIVTIFFTFANVFISSGFNTALIQKKETDVKDYSTVLYVSIGVSLILYSILFFTAPLIADLYSAPILVAVIRIMGLTLIVNAVKSVLCAYVSSTLQFKKFFYSTIIGTVISAFVGIALALMGFGPWALVAQQMTNTCIDTLILFLTTKIRFVLAFSWKRLKGLFGYSWKILVSSLISVIYEEINPLIIGIRFSGADLSYYTKGKSFPTLISNTISDTFSAVLFPVISKLQDDTEAVLRYTRRFMRVSSYLIFPLMVGFLAVSDNFVSVVLTDKWMPASIYIQIFCLSYMFNIIQNGNLQAIRAIGRSDIILILEVIKKSLYLVTIVAFILLSDKPEMLAVTSIINTLIATAVNTYPNRKLIGYRYGMQIMDILPNLLTSLAMGGAVYAMNFIPMNRLLLLLLQIICGAAAYILISIVTKNENFNYFINMFKNILNRRAEK
ncbi:MAG: lipopolysaccharide biosynthesis protein [Clostridia bacterium]|nr:lipopolysaccharide biosynthesis protein [Clostridia bacterium]